MFGLSRFRKPVPTSSDDSRLLEIASNLGQLLDLSNLDLKELRWMEWISAGRSARPVPSDWCFFQRDSMIMPASMIGMLTVDEWRPLIASSLIYEKKKAESLRGRAFLLTVLPLILVLAGTFAASVLLSMTWIILLYIILVIPVGALGTRRYSSDLKRARLEADTEASAVAGKESLLNTIRKIDAIGLDAVDEGGVSDYYHPLGQLKSGSRGRRIVGLPSISERIENLQGFPSTATYPAS